VNIHELEVFAESHLPRNAFDYYASGANDMQTLRENRQGFARLRLRPRVLRDVSSIDTSVEILGKRISMPICIAPTAMHRMAHHHGEEATARAASAEKTCMILSTLSTTSLEDVAAANGDGIRWFQLYVYRDRSVTMELVRRAEAAGYEALVLTVDTPVLGRREADVRNNFQLPSHLKLRNFADNEVERKAYVEQRHGAGGSALEQYAVELIDPSLTWRDVEWLKTITRLPIVVKGVMTAEDARLAVAHKVAGVLVSNHGARQLDGVTSTIEALPEVAHALRGSTVELFLDGGIRRGTEVLKALALGARAVFLGRPVLWGLAYKGEEGVAFMLRLLRSEFTLAMRLAGCASVADVTGDLVAHESTYWRSRL